MRLFNRDILYEASEADNTANANASAGDDNLNQDLAATGATGDNLNQDMNAAGAGFGTINQNDDNQTILLRLITISKNFETVFRKFELLFPGCPMNDIIENRLEIIKKLLKHIINHKDDKDKILDAYQLTVKFIRVTDDHLTKYVKNKIKKEKEKKENNQKDIDNSNMDGGNDNG